MVGLGVTAHQGSGAGPDPGQTLVFSIRHHYPIYLPPQTPIYAIDLPIQAAGFHATSSQTTAF